MYRVVAFDCVSNDVFNAVARECLAKFFREVYEKPEVGLENRSIDIDVFEASINRPRLGATLTKEPRRRFQSRLPGTARAVCEYGHDRVRQYHPTVYAQFMTGVGDDERGTPIFKRTWQEIAYC